MRLGAASRPGRRGLLACLALIAAGLAGGCGVGPGEAADGEATLTVSRDFGSTLLLEEPVADLRETTTVLDALDLAADVETRYGGGFVQSIDGVGGGAAGERLHDWFFYVNGVESEVGAAQVKVRPGDRIWWDERTWSGAMRVPAVVGSFPQPLVGEGPVGLDCRAPGDLCDLAQERLADAGIESEPVDELDPAAAGEVPRVLVGAWPELDGDPAAELLAGGPQHSGVFAQFAGRRLQLLDVDAAVDSVVVSDVGVVAAVRVGEDRPVWVVSGTDDRGVEAAIGALDPESLANRYAIAAWPDDAAPDGLQVIGLPILEPTGEWE